MNVSEFTRTVKEMRQAQKMYFKARTRTHLIKAMELEQKVDRALEEGIVFDLDIVKVDTVKQGQLFDRGADHE